MIFTLMYIISAVMLIMIMTSVEKLESDDWHTGEKTYKRLKHPLWALFFSFIIWLIPVVNFLYALYGVWMVSISDILRFRRNRIFGWIFKEY